MASNWSMGRWLPDIGHLLELLLPLSPRPEPLGYSEPNLSLGEVAICQTTGPVPDKKKLIVGMFNLFRVFLSLSVETWFFSTNLSEIETVIIELAKIVIYESRYKETQQQ